MGDLTERQAVVRIGGRQVGANALVPSVLAHVDGDDVPDVVDLPVTRQIASRSAFVYEAKGLSFTFDHEQVEELRVTWRSSAPGNRLVGVGEVQISVAWAELPAPVVRRWAEARTGARQRRNALVLLQLLYGAGLRVSELVVLRVKDLDFAAGTVTVHAAKGDKDRVTTLPQRLVEPLHAHLEEVRRLHESDLAAGDAPLPDALARKYPQAGRQWPWQFVFPSHKLNVDRAGVIRRWHVAVGTVQKAARQAALKARISKPVSPHTFRHAYATHLLLQGVGIG